MGVGFLEWKVILSAAKNLEGVSYLGFVGMPLSVFSGVVCRQIFLWQTCWVFEIPPCFCGAKPRSE